MRWGKRASVISQVTPLPPTEGAPLSLITLTTGRGTVARCEKGQRLWAVWLGREDVGLCSLSHILTKLHLTDFSCCLNLSLSINSNLLNGSSSHLCPTIYSSADLKGGWLISFSYQSPQGANSFEKGPHVDDHVGLSGAVEKEEPCIKS